MHILGTGMSVTREQQRRVSSPFVSPSHAVRSLFVLLALSIFLVSASVAQGARKATFPLSVSANGRYLVGANNVPFFIAGDAAWTLISNLTKAEVLRYLDDRARHGSTAVFAYLIDEVYGASAPANLEGKEPFRTPGDFSTPNPAYFAHAAWVIKQAERRGIAVWLLPASVGYDGSEWWDDIIRNGPTKCREYGRFLGERFKNLSNIVWMHGGDFSPPSGSEGETNALEILKGINDVNPTSFHTFHGARSPLGLQLSTGSLSTDQVNFARYLNLNGVYHADEAYFPSRVGEAYTLSLRAYNQPNAMPQYVIEGRYECPVSNCPGSTLPTYLTNDPRLIRRQAYWADLSGGTGQFFGNEFVWSFAHGSSGFAPGYWDGPEGIGSVGHQDMERLNRLFTSHDWYKLVPDQDHATVTAGHGTFGAGDYVTAARAEDGSLVMAYLPPTGTETRTLTIDMSQLSGVATAQWFNPTTGTYTTIAGSPFANVGSTNFATPGDNGTGTNDWVLVLQTCTRRSTNLIASGLTDNACRFR